MNQGSHDVGAAGDGSHPHPPHLAHHYRTPQQQFAAGKLGMWIFLVTEILMFGGLFCGYAVYRANHPEIFIWGHQFLDKYLGGLNTIVLIGSSLTMAWAVRAAQLNRQGTLKLCLALTILGGLIFMTVKYVEYRHKWHEGLLWGKMYSYQPHESHAHAASQPATTLPHLSTAAATATRPQGEEAAQTVPASGPAPQPTPPEGPAGLAAARPALGGGHEPIGDAPRHIQLFFSWYFAMTGLHGIHVLVGMGLITWILIRATKGHFSSEYFTPVDLVGLYWHLVDLIWIYLFPLLYLIH